ncbi:MAG: sulfatase, partial [Planctomycetota bacterium]
MKVATKALPVRFLALVFLLCLSGCSRTPLESAGSSMNLLLITLDTVRADHLGCYGYEKNTSPTLDKLAATSILFEQAVAQSAVTPVSHASILTGLNPFHHGLRSLHGGLNFCLSDDQTTLAEILLAQGYATAAFVSAFPATRHYGLDQGFETWDQTFKSEDGQGLLTEKGIVNTDDAQRRGDETTDRALAWMNQQKETPFFLWVHYFDAHDGVIRPPDDYSKQFPPRSSHKLDELRANYDAEIAFVDDQVKRLLDELERMQSKERTVVAIIGDHG